MKKRNRKVTGRFLTQKQLPKENPSLEEIAKGQKDYDVKNMGDDYSGERSPYWDWAEAHSTHSDEGEIQEMPHANPDYLMGEVVQETPNIREAFITLYPMLTDKEKKVFGYLKIEKTDGEIAEKIGTSQRAINKIRNNIAKKLEKVLKQA